MQKAIGTLLILLAGSICLPAQQGYTYEVDEEFIYYPQIFRDVEGLVLTEENEIVISAEFHNASGHQGLVRLHPDGSYDADFGMPSMFGGGGGELYKVPDGYMTFDFQPNKYSLNGQLHPNYDYYFVNNFPIPSADDMDFLPLPDGRFYVSGRIYLDSLGNKAHLVRMMPDGSVDTTFTPRVVNESLADRTAVMHFYDDERMLVGGNFNTFEGHVSPHMVRVFLDGSVDTTFTAEFVDRWYSSPRYVDDQDRIMVTDPSGGFHTHPEDTLRIMRILHDGREDTTFHCPLFIGVFDQQSPDTEAPPAVLGVVPEDDGGYIIYGYFSQVNGHPRNGIAKIDSTGQLDTTVFAGQLGAQIDYDSAFWLVPWDLPGVRVVIRMPDDGLLVGGLFSHFNGVQRFNLVKLKKVEINTAVKENERPELSIFPNPAGDRVSVSLPGTNSPGTLQIFDLNGRLLRSEPANGSPITFETSDLAAGIYTLRWEQDGKPAAVGRLVIR